MIYQMQKMSTNISKISTNFCTDIPDLCENEIILSVQNMELFCLLQTRDQKYSVKSALFFPI